MKRVKRLLGDLIAAAVAVLLICLALTAPYQVEVHASAPGPIPYTAPANGAGRITTASKLPSSKKILAAQGEAEIEEESDADFESYEQVTVNEDAEEIVEVIPEREDPPATELDALIREAAERYGLPWELVSAVCWAESRYNPDAISGTPDYGLMQVTASVCAAYGLTSENRLDPAANLDAGCRILREKIDESGGDFTLALMKYNEGDAGYLDNIAAGIWSTEYTEDVLGKYYQILREG